MLTILSEVFPSPKISEPLKVVNFSKLFSAISSNILIIFSVSTPAINKQFEERPSGLSVSVLRTKVGLSMKTHSSWIPPLSVKIISAFFQVD